MPTVPINPAKAQRFAQALYQASDAHATFADGCANAGNNNGAFVEASIARDLELAGDAIARRFPGSSGAGRGRNTRFTYKPGL